MFTLQVEMFGRFHVAIENNVIVNESSRNTKATALLAYLLYNKDRCLTQEELINVLQLSGESENPYNVLKNIVYRLRKMFDVPQANGCCIISFKKGSYSLSNEINYNIDFENFCTLISKIRECNVKSDECLADCMEAIALYKGDFLPKQSAEMWAVGAAVRFQKDYIYTLRKAYAILSHRSSQEMLLDELNRAVYMYPYEESLHAKRINCLTKLGQYEQAVEEYNNVCDMLRSELGVNPSEELRIAYNNISENIIMQTASIDEARDNISEKTSGDGAYYCNLESFASTFRYIVRNFERTGQSVYLLLCTLRDKQGNELKRGAELTQACDSFLSAADSSMRRGDIYTRYSPSQFLVMLPNINRENCNIVIDRIQKKFYKTPSKSKTTLRCQILPAVDMGDIIDMKSKRPSW